MVAATNAKSLDPVSKEMLFEGLNLSQLEIAFRMDHRVLVQKLHGIEPTGKRNGYAVYKIHEVAPHLVKPLYDIETYIKRMNHTELPKHLTKEFWAGLKSRQDYELRAGHLWPTTDVIEKVGEVFKLVQMSCKLATDNLERNVELTERQRDGINDILNAMLEDLARNIRENFKEPEEEAANGTTDQSAAEPAADEEI